MGCYYEIVRSMILDRLADGTLSPGDKLPTERQLSEELSLNRNTVRHALLKLQREGRIYRLERKGWYVTPARLVYDPSHYVNFVRLAAAQGRVADWTTEDLGIVSVEGADAGDEDGFLPGTTAYKMVNIFLLDGQKVAYTVNYLNAERLNGIVPKTRYRALPQVVEEDYGICLAQRDLLIRPELLARDVSSALGLSEGSPGVYIRRIKTDELGQVVTVEHEYWRHDAIELRVSR